MTSRLLVVAVTALAAVTALSVGRERPGPILRATAGGALQLESSRDGAAVLSASRLRPGDSAEGTLTLKNLAAGPQRLTLTTSDLRDVPGSGGGELSTWARLRVERGPDTVFAGALADLATLDLGALPPGAATPFRFVVTLPEQWPAVDDAYAGGSAEVAGSGRGAAATGPGATGELPTVPPRADVAPSGRPQAPPVPLDELEGPAATRAPRVRLWVGGPAAQRMGRDLDVSALCRPGCTVRAAAKVRVGRRWRTLGRRALGAVASGPQPAALEFSLSALQQRSLRATLRRHGALTVRILVTASAPGHAEVTKVRTLRLRP